MSAHVERGEYVRLYESGMTIQEVAAALGKDRSAVRVALLKAGIRLRRTSPKCGQRIPATTEEMKALYDSGMSTHEIAHHYGATPKSIQDRLRRGGFQFRPKSATRYLRGAASPKWKGGRYVMPTGYVRLRVSPGRSQYEHRVVMEQALGRTLDPSEQVHHLNGIRDDNRVENLAIVVQEQHERLTLLKAHQRRVRELEEVLRQHHIVLSSPSGTITTA